MFRIAGLRCLHSGVGIENVVRVVTALAERQHGLVRTNQLQPEDQARLRHLARRGMVRRIAKGVYQVGGSPVTWRQRLQAGVWALGPSAVVSHAAAAQLLGFDTYTDEILEFTVDRSCRGRSPSGFAATVHTSMVRPQRDRLIIEGLPVTTASRTVFDLARSSAPRHQLEAAVDSALRQRLTTLDVLVERLAAVTGPARWGIARLADVLVTAGGHSYLERRFLQLVHTAGLPMPAPQVVHRQDGRHVARVDFLFEQANVVVEVSGGRGHTSPSDRARDARRRNRLQQLGRVVLEFTYEQITAAEDEVVDVLAQSLGLDDAA